VSAAPRAGTLVSATAWRPPADWRRIETLDAHAAGEPLRVVLSGAGPIPGESIVAKRKYAREHLEALRRAVIFEPRGHADMYGAIPTDPATPDGEMRVLFLHNESCSKMCGHGIIALTSVVLETGMLPWKDELRIDAPAGRVLARPRRRGERVASVAFENVPSFAYVLDRAVDVPGIGHVRYDIAFGGAFYAYVDAATLGLALTPERYRDLIDAGRRIKRAVMASQEIRHPYEDELSFLYGTIFVGDALGAGAASRNECVFAEGQVESSPTGTGVSGRVALEHARGRLPLGKPFVVESIIGTRFTGRAIRATRFGPHDAVVPEIEGSAYLTGRSELWLGPDDPLNGGFMLR